MAIIRLDNRLDIARFMGHLQDLTDCLTEPVFVKVGANDGVTGDPCGDLFLRSKNWKGLLIEPVPYCFERLRSIYSDSKRFSLAQIAIGKEPGLARFFYPSPECTRAFPDLPAWYDQLGSFDRRHILKHLNGMLEPFIVESLVEVQPLHSVVRDYGIHRVELLHIDTEGHDLQVLETVDWNAVVPMSVFVEHVHLSPEHRWKVYHLLRSNGYSVGDCGTDFFALHDTWQKQLRPAAT